MAQKNLLVNRNRLTDMEIRLAVAEGERREWDGLGVRGY